jgi:hypothetical protein
MYPPYRTPLPMKAIAISLDMNLAKQSTRNTTKMKSSTCMDYALSPLFWRGLGLINKKF